MKQAGKEDLESSPDYVTVAIGSLPVSVQSIGLNASRKSPNDRRYPRGIFYKGACTLTKLSGDSEDLIPTTDYTYLPLQYAAIESAANDVFVIF